MDVFGGLHKVRQACEMLGRKSITFDIRQRSTYFRNPGDDVADEDDTPSPPSDGDSLLHISPRRRRQPVMRGSSTSTTSITPIVEERNQQPATIVPGTVAAPEADMLHMTAIPPKAVVSDATVLSAPSLGDGTGPSFHPVDADHRESPSTMASGNGPSPPRVPPCAADELARDTTPKEGNTLCCSACLVGDTCHTADTSCHRRSPPATIAAPSSFVAHTTTTTKDRHAQRPPSLYIYPEHINKHEERQFRHLRTHPSVAFSIHSHTDRNNHHNTQDDDDVIDGCKPGGAVETTATPTPADYDSLLYDPRSAVFLFELDINSPTGAALLSRTQRRTALPPSHPITHIQLIVRPKNHKDTTDNIYTWIGDADLPLALIPSIIDHSFVRCDSHHMNMPGLPRVHIKRTIIISCPYDTGNWMCITLTASTPSYFHNKIADNINIKMHDRVYAQTLLKLRSKLHKSLYRESQLATAVRDHDVNKSPRSQSQEADDNQYILKNGMLMSSDAAF